MSRFSYSFSLSADDEGILLLSADDDPANIKQIAGDNASCCGPARSQLIPLVAGHHYLILAISKEHNGDDYLSVSWQGPGITPEQVIADKYLLSIPPSKGWTAT